MTPFTWGSQPAGPQG